MVRATVTAKFPGALVVDGDVGIASNVVSQALTADASAGAVTMTFGSTTGYEANMYLRLRSINGVEVVKVVTVDSGVQLTVSRAQDGTTAVAHPANTAAECTVIALGHNQLLAEVKALETFLGITGGIVTWDRGIILTPTADANGGAQLVDTPAFGWRGKYWTGVASATYTFTNYLDMTATTPAGTLKWEVEGTPIMTLSSISATVGVLGIDIIQVLTGAGTLTFKNSAGTTRAQLLDGGTFKVDIIQALATGGLLDIQKNSTGGIRIGTTNNLNNPADLALGRANDSLEIGGGQMTFQLAGQSGTMTITDKQVNMQNGTVLLVDTARASTTNGNFFLAPQGTGLIYIGSSAVTGSGSSNDVIIGASANNFSRFYASVGSNQPGMDFNLGGGLRFRITNGAGIQMGQTGDYFMSNLMKALTTNGDLSIQYNGTGGLVLGGATATAGTVKVASPDGTDTVEIINGTISLFTNSARRFAALDAQVSIRSGVPLIYYTDDGSTEISRITPTSTATTWLGASGKHQIVSVAGTGGIVLGGATAANSSIEIGLTDNDRMEMASGVTRFLIGGTRYLNIISGEVQFVNAPSVIMYAGSGSDPRFTLTTSDLLYQPADATGGATTKNSPTITQRAKVWNGSASLNHDTVLASTIFAGAGTTDIDNEFKVTIRGTTGLTLRYDQGGSGIWMIVPSVADNTAVGTPANGMIVYNTTANLFKVYENGAWRTM